MKYNPCLTRERYRPRFPRELAYELYYLIQLYHMRAPKFTDIHKYSLFAVV